LENVVRVGKRDVGKEEGRAKRKKNKDNTIM